MSTLILEVPEEDLNLFRTWIKVRGLTPESGFSEMLHEKPRVPEGMVSENQPGLHPDIEALIGILPRDLDAKAAYGEYLEKKYLR